MNTAPLVAKPRVKTTGAVALQHAAVELQEAPVGNPTPSSACSAPPLTTVQECAGIGVGPSEHQGARSGLNEARRGGAIGDDAGDDGPIGGRTGVVIDLNGLVAVEPNVVRQGNDIGGGIGVQFEDSGHVGSPFEDRARTEGAGRAKR